MEGSAFEQCGVEPTFGRRLTLFKASGGQKVLMEVPSLPLSLKMVLWGFPSNVGE